MTTSRMGASRSFRRLLVPKQRVLTNAKETANRRIGILQHEVIITERHAMRISVFISSHDRVSSCQFRHEGLLWILLVACQAFHGRHIPLAHGWHKCQILQQDIGQSSARFAKMRCSYAGIRFVLSILVVLWCSRPFLPSTGSEPANLRTYSAALLILVSNQLFFTLSCMIALFRHCAFVSRCRDDVVKVYCDVASTCLVLRCVCLENRWKPIPSLFFELNQLVMVWGGSAHAQFRRCPLFSLLCLEHRPCANLLFRASIPSLSVLESASLFVPSLVLQTLVRLRFSTCRLLILPLGRNNFPLERQVTILLDEELNPTRPYAVSFVSFFFKNAGPAVKTLQPKLSTLRCF